LTTRVALSCRERTREIYEARFERDILPTLGDLLITELKRNDVIELLAAKAKSGRVLAGVKTILMPLRAMLNAAVEDNLIPGNPATRIGRLLRGLAADHARPGTALTAKELAVLLAAADAHVSDFSDLVHVLTFAGLRVGEACGLKWTDLDSHGGFLNVDRTVSWTRGRVRVTAPKSGRTRRVDIPVALVARLDVRRTLVEADAALEGREASQWVLPDPSGQDQPLDVRYFRIKRWPRLLRAAGLRGIRPHDLRHTYATHLLLDGTPVAYVKEQLGHSSIQITVDLYAHAIPNANRDAVERLARIAAATPDGRERQQNLDSTWMPDNCEVSS
jgi:integrase